MCSFEPKPIGVQIRSALCCTSQLAIYTPVTRVLQVTLNYLFQVTDEDLSGVSLQFLVVQNLSVDLKVPPFQSKIWHYKDDALTIVCINLVLMWNNIIPVVGNPSCLHTTSASNKDHPLLQTVPHVSLKQISTRPSYMVRPPASLTSPF